MKTSKRTWIYFLPLLVFVVLAVVASFGYMAYLNKNLKKASETTTSNLPVTQPKTTIQTPATQSAYTFPLPNFDSRILYRWFGKYVSSADVVPDCGAKFSGYHNGDDLEVTAAEKSTDVPVYAISNGVVRQASYVSGYGGLLILGLNINGQDYTVNYGHIRLSSALPVGTLVKSGQKLAVLGTGCSLETNGERKHLHFAIHKGASIDVAGYVQSQVALSAWVDPKSFLAALKAQNP